MVSTKKGDTEEVKVMRGSIPDSPRNTWTFNLIRPSCQPMEYLIFISPWLEE